jgi:hypothetical protein
MASESYGYMAPIKAALDSSLAFLTKSFSRFSRVRFNAVAPGLLKTSASAGIPGYVDAYLYAEQVIPRKQAVETEEVANLAAFLLSPRSSGITAQRIVVDAGMSINYFDRRIVERMTRDWIQRHHTGASQNRRTAGPCPSAEGYGLGLAARRADRLSARVNCPGRRGLSDRCDPPTRRGAT